LHRDGDGNSYQKRRLADGSEHMVLKNFPTESELNAAVGEYGRSVQFVRLEYYWLFTYEKA
jgi:demethylmenaquinone methyltransferase/2-methoxy-6-polyprenyl-1,4-benzoquinol methylase